MARVFRNMPEVKEGKYLVVRRDGSVPEWPYFVIGAKDYAASAALFAYADKAEQLGYDPQYVADIRTMADEFELYVLTHGAATRTESRTAKTTQALSP